MVGARAPHRPGTASATLAPRQGPVHHGRVGRGGGAAQRSQSRVRVAARRSRSSVLHVGGGRGHRVNALDWQYSRAMILPSGQSRYCNNKTMSTCFPIDHDRKIKSFQTAVTCNDLHIQFFYCGFFNSCEFEPFLNYGCISTRSDWLHPAKQ